MRSNLTLLTDLYQLTMMYNYSKNECKNRKAIFDLFYRGVGNSYALVCGLEQVIDYIENLKFTDDDIEYLRSLNKFDEDFFKELKKFKFTGNMYAVPEGKIVFPYEPILIVEAPLFQAQLIETAILCILNHQTLIATKTMKIMENAQGKPVAEFGLRRAQGPDAALYGARAAVIAGCSSTSNVLAGKMFNIPISGTHSHSFVMSFPDELTAFREYAKTFPNECLLLVDTYDTLKSGVPNAIIVFDELKAKGYKPVGVRLDSGDLAYLSKRVREMLDSAGHNEVKIFASSDIDENILRALNAQNAKIDAYGIGTKLITSDGCPSLGGVYKLAGIENDKGEMEPRMKFSDTTEKVTNPGLKKVVRFFDNKNDKALADLIALKSEDFSNIDEIEIFDPVFTWKRKKIKNFHVEELMQDIFIDGKCVYNIPSIEEIQSTVKKSINEIWEEYRRDLNPNTYKVDLSQALYDLKQEIIMQKKNKINE